MFHNLLPKERKKALRLEYYTRLATLAAFLLSIAFIAGIIALFPSYVDVKGSVSAQKKELEKKEKEAEENRELIDETIKSAYVIRTLSSDFEKENFTEYINEITKKRPEGISIIGFSYDRISGSLILEGVAEARDMVAPFARTLESHESFESVPVPIADLAEKENLSFHLRIGLLEKNKKKE